MLMIDCEKEVSSRGLPFYNYWYWLNCVDIGDVLTETNTSILSAVEEDLTLSTCLCTAKVSEPVPAAQWLSKQSLMQVLSSPSVQMVAGIFNLALPLALTCLVNKFNWKGVTNQKFLGILFSKKRTTKQNFTFRCWSIFGISYAHRRRLEDGRQAALFPGKKMAISNDITYVFRANIAFQSFTARAEP